MDLTTLAAAFFMAVGLLSADAVIYSNSVIVEVAAPPKTDKFDIDRATLEEEFEDQLFAIAKVSSVVSPPEIRASRQQGIGMALAKEVKLQDFAYAIESEIGYNPDRLRFALFVEGGVVKGLVSGSSHRVGNFRHVLIPLPNEPLIEFVHRCSLWGAAQLAPYATALYLIERHAADKDFRDAIALVETTKARLPAAPVHFDRSVLENLLGLVALFHNDAKAAHAAFERSAAAHPDNAVAVLNLAFTDLQLDDDQSAADRMQRLITTAPPKNKVLLSTAYATWAAAELGLQNPQHADALAKQALDIFPDSSTAMELAATAKEMLGDKEAAADLHHQALQSALTFENYAEVAALYFQLAWQDNKPVTRSTFTNPSVLTFH